MGTRITLPPKYVGESLNLPPFDFISRLGVTETLVSAVATATVYSGTDPSPGSIISGAAVISGTQVTQKVVGGLLGVIYEILITALTSLGQSLEMSGYLAIVPDLL
jgi:hypothetical protein